MIEGWIECLGVENRRRHGRGPSKKVWDAIERGGGSAGSRRGGEREEEDDGGLIVEQVVGLRVSLCRMRMMMMRMLDYSILERKGSWDAAKGWGWCRSDLRQKGGKIVHKDDDADRARREDGLTRDGEQEEEQMTNQTVGSNLGVIAETVSGICENKKKRK